MEPVEPQPTLTRTVLVTQPWVIVLAVAVAATIGTPILFLMSTRTAGQSIISPIAEQTMEDSSLSSLPSAVSSSSPYTPSQYIYFSQSYFADGQAMSQNRQQSDEDKKQILAKLQQSLDTISEGIQQYPKRAELWAHRAAIERALTGITPNALASAIADMEQAYQLSPQNPDYGKTLSDLYLKAQQLDKATFYLTQTQALKPNDPQLLYNLAQLQVKAGLLAAANVSFTKLLPLVTDANQKEKVKTEKAAVEQLLSQAGNIPQSPLSPQSPQFSPPQGLELLPAQQTLSRELVVAAPDDSLSPYEDTVAGSAYSGSATLPKGQTSVTIENTRVSDTAPIYVTPQGATNATLTVASKKAGSHFVVSVDNPQQQDVNFQWWILTPQE